MKHTAVLSTSWLLYHVSLMQLPSLTSQGELFHFTGEQMTIWPTHIHSLGAHHSSVCQPFSQGVALMVGNTAFCTHQSTGLLPPTTAHSHALEQQTFSRGDFKEQVSGPLSASLQRIPELLWNQRKHVGAQQSCLQQFVERFSKPWRN